MELAVDNHSCVCRAFSINRVYIAGVTACGSALVGIAGATEREEFQELPELGI